MDRLGTRATFVAALTASPPMRPQPTQVIDRDARLLDAADFRESSAEAFLADIEITKRISHLVATAFTVDEVAEGLRITGAQVHRKRLKRQLWGITDGQSWMLPTLQFESHNDCGPLRVIPGIDQVFKALPEDLHPLAVEGFLSTPQPDLYTNHPVTPREWLHNGRDIATVITVASAVYL